MAHGDRTDGPVEEAISELTVGDDRIKVILTAPVFFPDLKGGYNRVIRLSTPLAELGVDLFLFTALRSHHESNRIDVERIKVFRFPEPENIESNELRARLYERAHHIAQRCPANIPIVLEPLPPAWPLWKGLFAPWHFRRPVVFDCGNNPEIPRGLTALWKLRILTYLLFFPLQKISVLSSEMRRLFVKAGVPARKISVIPNGVDTEQFRPLNDEDEKLALRKKFEISPNAKVVLFVASVVPRKRLELILNDWNLVTEKEADAQLIVAGSMGARLSFGTGHEDHLNDYARGLQDRVADLDKPDSVTFLDEIDDIHELHRCADLFVLTSREEGIPNALLEAMASGVPAITVPFIGIPRSGEEIGDAGRHHIRVPADPEAISGEIVKWIADGAANERKKLASAARDFILQHQSNAESARKWAETYRSVVHTPC